MRLFNIDGRFVVCSSVIILLLIVSSGCSKNAVHNKPVKSIQMLGRGLWNPSGTALLVRNKSGGLGSLYIVETKSGGIARIATSDNGTVMHPYWSSDGRLVAFSTADSAVRAGDSNSLPPLSTYEYNAISRKTRFIAQGMNAAYSPDGALISLVCGKPDEGQYLALIDLPTRSVEELRDRCKLFIWPFAYVWSPDSHKICFRGSPHSENPFDGFYIWALQRQKWVLKQSPSAGSLRFSLPRWSNDSKTVDFFHYGEKWGSVEAVRWDITSNRTKTLWSTDGGMLRWLSFVPGSLNAWILQSEGKRLVLKEYDAKLKRCRILRNFVFSDTENVSIDWCRDGSKASIVTDDWLAILDRSGRIIKKIEARKLN